MKRIVCLVSAIAMAFTAATGSALAQNVRVGAEVRYRLRGSWWRCRGFSFDLLYNLGLSDINDVEGLDESLENRNIQFTIGYAYLFGGS